MAMLFSLLLQLSRCDVIRIYNLPVFSFVIVWKFWYFPQEQISYKKYFFLSLQYLCRGLATFGIVKRKLKYNASEENGPKLMFNYYLLFSAQHNTVKRFFVINLNRNHNLTMDPVILLVSLTCFRYKIFSFVMPRYVIWHCVNKVNIRKFKFTIYALIAYFI